MSKDTIKQALEAIRNKTSESEIYNLAYDALELLSAEQQEEAQPTAPHIVEALSWHANERDDLTLDDAVEVTRHGWKKVHGRTERQLVLQVAALLAAAPSSAAPDQPQAGQPEETSQQNARFAIDGAIQYGRMGINPPPAADHWLAEYWNIGRKLAVTSEHIRAMPHGDNCFVSNHYEADPGNRCNCGKDSLLEWMEGDSDTPPVHRACEEWAKQCRAEADKLDEDNQLRIFLRNCACAFKNYGKIIALAAAPVVETVQPQEQQTIECRVYKSSTGWSTYISARFKDKTANSFEFAGHRWMYRHTSFDDSGDYDLLYRFAAPSAETVQPAMPEADADKLRQLRQEFDRAEAAKSPFQRAIESASPFPLTRCATSNHIGDANEMIDKEASEAAQDEREPIDANALERMAKERPNDCFLKGSGVLKLTGAIRSLEQQLRAAPSSLPVQEPVGTASYCRVNDEYHAILDDERVKDGDALYLAAPAQPCRDEATNPYERAMLESEEWWKTDEQLKFLQELFNRAEAIRALRTQPAQQATAEQSEPAQAVTLTDKQKTELLDWVSACQSAYHIDNTPGHRFGGLGSNLQENKDSLIEYVESLLSGSAKTDKTGDANG